MSEVFLWGREIFLYIKMRPPLTPPQEGNLVLVTFFIYTFLKMFSSQPNLTSPNPSTRGELSFSYS